MSHVLTSHIHGMGGWAWESGWSQLRIPPLSWVTRAQHESSLGFPGGLGTLEGVFQLARDAVSSFWGRGESRTVLCCVLWVTSESQTHPHSRGWWLDSPRQGSRRVCRMGDFCCSHFHITVWPPRALQGPHPLLQALLLPFTGTAETGLRP